MATDTGNSLPHKNVYTRLKQSKIDGIGVFAIRNIKKKTNIFSDANDRIVWIDKKRVCRLKGHARDLYERYCVCMGNKIGVPVSFNMLSVSWYLNHSFKPNAHVDQDYCVITNRNIRKGEEITLDYRTFMDIEIPKNWKK